jgi:hypothetical protein
MAEDGFPSSPNAYDGQDPLTQKIRACHALGDYAISFKKVRSPSPRKNWQGCAPRATW